MPHLSGNSNSISTYLVLIFAGAVTALSFSPFDFFFVPAITFACIFYYWLRATPGQAFIQGFCFGVGLFTAGVGWLYISISLFGGVVLPVALLLTFLLVCYLSLFVASAGYLSTRCRTSNLPFNLIILFPAIYCLLEWCRSWFLTGFPWLSLGYTQTDTILAGYAPVAGVSSVGWMILIISGGLLTLFKLQGKSKVIPLLVIVGVCVTGWVLQSINWTQRNDEQLSVTLVQGGIPQEKKWLPQYRNFSLELYLSMTIPHLKSDLIIWPETAIPAYYHEMDYFIDRLEQLVQKKDTFLLTGIPVKNVETGQYYNSILALGSERQIYNKRHLVPFGEYIPLTPILGPIIRALKIPISGFSPGEKSQSPLLVTPQAKLGMSICYEDIFPYQTRSALPHAQILVNVSNDAWFGNSAAPHQHLQMARMRAIESGRYMVRGTNTGISAIIDEKGRINSISDQFNEDTVTDSVTLFSGSTPYSRLGDIPVMIILLIIVIGSRFISFTRTGLSKDS